LIYGRIFKITFDAFIIKQLLRAKAQETALSF